MDKFFVNGGCSTDSQYFTGVGKCDVAEGVLDYLLITRSGAKYAIPADGDFTETIKKSLLLPYNDANKMWIVGKITTNNAPEGGDAIKNTKGTRGGSVTTGQNPISISYAMPGGVCVYNQLSKFNGMECRVLRLDRNSHVFGVADETTIKGFSASLWCTQTPEADGGDVEMITITVSFGVDYFKELSLRSNLKVSTLPDALRPIYIEKGTAAKTAKLIYGCSREALDDATCQLLATAFKPSETATEAVLAAFVDNNGNYPTAVAYANGVFTFTFATGTATATSVKLNTPDVLALAGVSGIEGDDDLAVIA